MTMYGCRIIDNMINIDLLFTSAQLTGNKTLESIAISHADTTMKNHFRPGNYSTWHLVVYNTYTGNVTEKVTSQGYADWSTWTRGQSWAMSGFAQSKYNILHVNESNTPNSIGDSKCTVGPATSVIWRRRGSPQTYSSPIFQKLLMFLHGESEIGLANYTTPPTRSCSGTSTLPEILPQQTLRQVLSLRQH